MTASFPFTLALTQVLAMACPRIPLAQVGQYRKDLREEGCQGQLLGDSGTLSAVLKPASKAAANHEASGFPPFPYPR